MIPFFAGAAAGVVLGLFLAALLTANKR